MALVNEVPVEHHYHEVDRSDTAAAWIVGLVALLIIVGFALFAARAFPFNYAGTTPATQSTVNVTTPDTTTTPPTNTTNTTTTTTTPAY